MEFSTGGGMPPPQGMPQAAPQGMGLPQLLPGAQQMFGAQLLNRVQPSPELMAAPPTAPPGMQININTPNFDALAAAQAATRDRAALALAGQAQGQFGKGGGLAGKGSGVSGLVGQMGPTGLFQGGGQQVEERSRLSDNTPYNMPGGRPAPDNRFNGIY